MSELEQLNKNEENKDPESIQDGSSSLPVTDPGLVIINKDGEIDRYVPPSSRFDDESINWADSILHLPVMDYDKEDPKKVWKQEAFDAFASSDMPESFLNELVQNIKTQYVMGGQFNILDDQQKAAYEQTNPHSMHVMLVSLAVYDAALKDQTFIVADELNEAVAEAVAVALDQLITIGDGEGRPVGLAPYEDPAREYDDPETKAKRDRIVAALTNTDLAQNQINITAEDMVRVQQAYLDVLGIKPGTTEAQEAIARANWYMNSNTGLNVATAKYTDGTYLIDQDDPALQTVGVPDSFLGSPIVYNEWMDDPDYRYVKCEIVGDKADNNEPITEDDIKVKIGENSNAIVIYGQIDSSYEINFGSNIKARHYEETLKPYDPGYDPDNKGHGIVLGVYISGEVKFDHAINGKLPYVVLRSHFEPYTPEEIETKVNKFIEKTNYNRNRWKVKEETGKWPKDPYGLEDD